MKNFLILFLFMCFISPVFSEEEQKPDENSDNRVYEEEKLNENIEEDDKNKDIVKYNYVRNRAQISPKKIHNKIKSRAEKSLEKNKTNFYKLKDKELWLLQDEANFLDYHP